MKPDSGHWGRYKFSSFIILSYIYVNCKLDNKNTKMGSVQLATNWCPAWQRTFRRFVCWWQYLSLEVISKGVACHPALSPSMSNVKCTQLPGKTQHDQLKQRGHKQRVLMHGHQRWNVRHGLCHIYMIYVYIWVVHSFCLFCCLFIIVTTQFVALYEPCKPKPKPKPSTYDTRTTTPWQRSKFRYLDRSQSNKYAINMQIQTISVSK